MADNDENYKVTVSPDADDSSEHAADLIRQKVNSIYNSAPSIENERGELANVEHRSKHQQFIYNLTKSTSDLVTIQTKWHEYYAKLSNKEKHEVWQEFYDSQPPMTQRKASAVAKPKSPKKNRPSQRKPHSSLIESRPKKAKLSAKHHLQSLLFGVSMGIVVVFIFLFGFFNEVIIAPFIQPARASASTPIIINTNGIAPTTTPEVIIPKINVQIPVDYSLNTTDESVIESDLEDGVVHYPTTVMPGQVGNAAFFGHSSNNIFNSGKYKFAFVLLHTLVPGDTFYLTNNDKVYVYQVISKTIVNPNDVAVLGNVAGQTATATLITCDPPGTSINRLVVVGKQISPNPSTNTAPVVSSVQTAKVLPNDGPSLWTRLTSSFIGKLVVVVVILGLIYWGWVKLYKPLFKKS